METITIGQKDYLIQTLRTDPFIKNAYTEDSMWDALNITDKVKKEIYLYYNNKSYYLLQKLLLSLGVKQNIKK